MENKEISLADKIVTAQQQVKTAEEEWDYCDDKGVGSKVEVQQKLSDAQKALDQLLGGQGLPERTVEVSQPKGRSTKLRTPSPDQTLSARYPNWSRRSNINAATKR